MKISCSAYVRNAISSSPYLSYDLDRTSVNGSPSRVRPKNKKQTSTQTSRNVICIHERFSNSKTFRTITATGGKTVGKLLKITTVNFFSKRNESRPVCTCFFLFIDRGTANVSTISSNVELSRYPFPGLRKQTVVCALLENRIVIIIIRTAHATHRF